MNILHPDLTPVRANAIKQAHHYDDLASFLADARNPCRAGKDDWKRFETYTSSFYGCDPATVERRVAQGWPEGVKRIDDNLVGFSATPPTSIKRKRTRGDQGEEVDIHAVMMGNLDTAWTRLSRRGVIAHRTITLTVSLCISAAAEPDHLFWKGAAAIAAADALENAGYSVEIMGNICGGGPSGYVTCTMVLKPANMPLDKNQIAATVANPGFFRKIGHQWHSFIGKGGGWFGPFEIERYAKLPENWIGGFDKAIDRTAAMAKVQEVLATIERWRS